MALESNEATASDPFVAVRSASAALQNLPFARFRPLA